MRAELLIKLGDSQALRAGENGWLDGMVVSWKTPGIWIPPADFQAWLDLGTQPQGLALLPAADQRMHDRFAARTRYLVDPATTPFSAAARYFSTREPSPRQVDVAQRNILEALAFLDKLQLHGYDTSFGYQDRRRFGLVVVDLQPRQLRDLTVELVDQAAHPFTPTRELERRAFRFPYEAELSGGTVDEWLDTDRTVILRRDVTPIAADRLLQRIEDRPPPPRPGPGGPEGGRRP